MINVIFGPEVYLAKKRIKELMNEKEGTEIKNFDLQEGDFFELIKKEFFNVDLFSQKKFFVLENASENELFQNAFLKEIKKFVQSPNIILFFEEQEKKNTFFKTLEKYGRVEKFNYLTPKQLEKYVEKMEKEKGIKLDWLARKKLIEMTGNNLWLLENEIQKLALLEKISLKSLQEIISSRIEIDIFETIEKMAHRKKREVLLNIYKHIKKNDSPLYLLSMFAYQLRQILGFKNLLEKYPSANFYSLQKQLNLRPFIVSRLLKTARNFKTEELKKLYEKLFFLDVRIKKGEITPSLALFLFLNNI